MPELVEFREVIESYPIVVAIMGIGVALFAVLVTRWMDQSSLDAVQERLAAYQDEVRQLNETRAELLARLEERGDELRRAKAQLPRREAHAQTEVQPMREPNLR